MTTANSQHQATDANLRQIFRTMDAHQAQEIRDAYYKAMEGLRTLATALEIADAQQTPTAGSLLDEHLKAVQALEAMKASRLKIL